MNIKTFNPFILFMFVSIIALGNQANGQTNKVDSTKNDSIMQNALKVYLNLDNCYSGCDDAFIRREINFVNYVTDMYKAQLEITIIQMTTGSGGIESTLIFNGMKDFKKLNDTLKIYSSVNNTTDETRKQIVNELKLALIRYVMRTPVKKAIDINFNNPAITNEMVKDKWNNWVYNANFNGYINNQQSTQTYNYYSSISAKKVTADWKYSFSVSNSYYESIFDLDTAKIKSFNRSNYFSASVIKSLSKHWSAGAFYNIATSTYYNEKLQNTLSTGIEYDIFPYSESTSKLFTLRYTLDLNDFRYIDTTIYNKLRETLADQSFNATLSYIKGWGSASANFGFTNYLKDFKQNNLSISGSLNIRICKGLTFNTSVMYSFIHNQLYLPKAGATLEEVLLQQHQLATQYTLYTMFGISYTFGSIYNNVVNPRFGN